MVPGAASPLLSSSSTSTTPGLGGGKILVPEVSKVPIEADELSSGSHHHALASAPPIWVMFTVIGKTVGFHTITVSPSLVRAVAL